MIKITFLSSKITTEIDVPYKIASPTVNQDNGRSWQRSMPPTEIPIRTKRLSTTISCDTSTFVDDFTGKR